MDTLLILRDTIPTHVVKVIGSCQPFIHEPETNWQDVAIVGIICLVVTICISIIIFAFCKWQKAKYKYLVLVDHQKHLHEIEIVNLEASRKVAKAEKEEKQIVGKENKKTDYQEAGEFFKHICDATKDKEGKFDNAALYNLLNFFREEWRGSKGSEGKNENSNDKSRSQHEK